MAANCSALPTRGLVGPVEVFASLGHWNTAVLVILGLHLVPVWLVSCLCLVRLRRHCAPALRPCLQGLLALPPTILTLAATGILLPSAGSYIEVLIEIVLSFGLVQFCWLCRLLCGGHSGLVTACRERSLLLPLGAPPLVCLLPAPWPKVTSANLAVVTALPGILLVYKVLMLVVDLTFLGTGYQPSGHFLALDNLHNLLSFPVGLSAIYAYTMFNILMNECLKGNNKRFLGVILLLEFVLFDCLRLFFIFLTGTGMLTCVPPFLTQGLVVHTLKNYIKAFLATFVGIPYLSLCSGPDLGQGESLGRMDSEASMLGRDQCVGPASDGSAEEPDT